MAIWLCRAGRYGQHEARFLEDNKIFYTFEEIGVPLSSFGSRKDLQEYFLQVTPNLKDNAAMVYATQGWSFFSGMKLGDWIITPSKTSPGMLHFAKVTGEYIFEESAEESYRHTRPVRWFAEMYRSQFEQDIQAALGALMTICKIKQEERIKKITTQALTGLKNEQAFTPPPRNICSRFGNGISRRNFGFPHSQLQRAWPCPNC